MPAPPSPGFELTLFIAGKTSRSAAAAESLRTILEGTFGKSGYTLDIIDVVKHPQLAEEFHILATPTLVRRRPQPERRVIGDLADVAEVARILGIPWRSNAGAQPAEA